MTRPAPRKSSLTGANPVRPPAEPAPAETAPEPTTPNRPTKPAKKPAKPAPRRDGEGEPTVRVGIYLAPEEFTDAKAAYLGAWQLGGQADTFARWVASAIDEHARRSPGERGRLSRGKGRAETRTGASRSFTMPAATVERMRQAISDDQTDGRWLSDSAWCGDAIAAAVSRVRDESGGTLPTPPARLPNRLIRPTSTD